MGKVVRRVVTGTLAAAGLTAVLAAPASAAPAASASVNARAAVPCSNFPGHYCARASFTSLSGGIRLNAMNSTAYTTAPGGGREWVVYTCNAGTCGVRPTNALFWNGRDVKLVARHTNIGLVLPCGANFGVSWRNPNTFQRNAPGGPSPDLVKFRVVCNGTHRSVEQTT